MYKASLMIACTAGLLLALAGPVRAADPAATSAPATPAASQTAPAAPGGPAAKPAPAKPGPSNPRTDAAEARYRAWVDQEHAQDATEFAKEKSKIEDKYKGYVRPKHEKKKAKAEPAPAKGD